MARLLTSMALLVGASVVAVASPQPAHADDVAVAQARVDALQDLEAATTVKLVEGTRKWEADQRALRTINVRLGNTRRHVAEAQAQVRDGQERLNAMARQLYTSGGRTKAQALMFQPPDAFLDAAQGLQMAERAAGSTQDVIARAATSRHRLRQQEADARALADSAQDLVNRSARRLTQLQALARETSDKLEAGQEALQAARARKAAAQAAAEAAAQASAARARAARERAARARVTPSPRVTFPGVPACSGRSTSGQQNGNLDPASLCPLWQAPGHRLRADAADAFNKMSKFHAATVGGPLCVTDSYRSYSEQVDLYQRKPGLAAVPGTSNHGWGQAVDFCGGIQNSGSAAYQWMKANAGRFGWRHPDWAEPSGSKPEPWHWEFGT